jgi:hypothetical protein
MFAHLEQGILDRVKNVYVINLTYNRSGTSTPAGGKGYRKIIHIYALVSD